MGEILLTCNPFLCSHNKAKGFSKVSNCMIAFVKKPMDNWLLLAHQSHEPEFYGPLIQATENCNHPNFVLYQELPQNKSKRGSLKLTHLSFG